MVLAFPPSESRSSLVSLESRAEMTFPKAESDRLILAASFRRSPLTPVLACLSLPARSTKLSFPTRMWLRPSGPGCPHSTVMVKMACERELCSFMLVKPTERARFPAFITLVNQWTSSRPVTMAIFFGQ
uniref:Uncharacterized protein n=1 Tax=Astyanax mexicanus TaxID=7994 RepID=A0A3B1JZH9_ASTMX